MHPFPHLYRVATSATPVGNVALLSSGLPDLQTAPPLEFDGPGDAWSPETLLVGAVTDCFVLSFRAVSGASKMPWTALSCTVEGTLDRVEKITQFTALHITAALVVPVEVGMDRAERMLQRAEQACLISNSLKASVTLTTQVTVG